MKTRFRDHGVYSVSSSWLVPALVSVLCAVLVCGNAWAIGCGGILNIAPQARVFDGGGKVVSAKVYFHPLEGAFLVVPDGDSFAYAADVANDRVIRIEIADLVFDVEKRTVDAREDVPYKLLEYRPRCTARGVVIQIGQSRSYEVKIER